MEYFFRLEAYYGCRNNNTLHDCQSYNNENQINSINGLLMFTWRAVNIYKKCSIINYFWRCENDREIPKQNHTRRLS